MLNVYLAGRYERHEQLLGYSQQLARLGYNITSSWLSGNEEYLMMEEQPLSVWRNVALRDKEDLEAADTLVAFTESPEIGYKRGARHWEMGYAYALGHEIIVVGPREHVFCYLPGIKQFDRYSDFLNYARMLSMSGYLL